MLAGWLAGSSTRIPPLTPSPLPVRPVEAVRWVGYCLPVYQAARAGRGGATGAAWSAGLNGAPGGAGRRRAEAERGAWSS